MSTRYLVLILLLVACRQAAESGQNHEAGDGNALIQTEEISPGSDLRSAIEEDDRLLGPGYLVWESNRTGSWRLWIRQLEGGEPRQLTPDEGQRIHCCPHISPDGQSIAFLSLPADQKLYPSGGAVGRMDWIRPDGSGQKTLLDSARNY